MNMDESRFMNWYWQEATPEEKQLHDKMYDFEPLFSDMVFEEGSASYDLIRCQSKKKDNDEWIDDVIDLPDEIRHFSYNYVLTKIEDIQVGSACYNSEEQALTIRPDKITDDGVLLHEMIHMYEQVIDELPKYFHDVLLWAIYQKLKKQVHGLDDAITQHVHVLNEWSIDRYGGSHDLLFLLKSFDLDIRQGYPLGTVFGYGAIDDYKYITYETSKNEWDADFTKVTPAEAAALDAAEAEIARGETVSDSEIDWDAD